MKPSLLIARIAGTEIRLHWTMLLILPYVYFTFRPENPLEGARAFLLIGLVFFSVLLHEIGHLLIARVYGVRVSSVVLWVLGGAAVTEREPEDPGAQLLIAGAGPIVNLLITAFFLILMAGGMLVAVFLPALKVSLPEVLPLRNFIFLMATNLILAISNLLPIYPLDGGRIFKALVHMFVGPARSALVTFWISTVLAVALLIWAVVSRSWLIGGTAFLLLVGAITLNQSLILWWMRVYARLTRRPELFLRLSDFDPAVKILSERIDQAPSNADLYLQRAYALYFLEDLGRALADTDRVLGFQPQNLPAILLRGALFYAMDQSTGAKACIDRAELIRPGWTLVHLNRAVLLRDAGRLEEALQEVNQALQTAAGEPTLHTPVLPLLTRSTILFKMGETQKAELDWKEALHANSREAAAFSPDRTRIFARDWAWVEAYFGWLEKNAPDRSLLPASRGEVSLRARRYSQAAADFSEAIQRHPTLRDLVYYRGMAYLGLGEKQKAADDFRVAVQVSDRAHIRRLAGMRLRSIGEA